MEAVSAIFDALFVLAVIISTWSINKSIDRLERKTEELEEKTNSKDIVTEEEEVKPVARKKRVRKPKVAKEIV